MQNTAFPDFISRYFWGDNVSDLSLEKNENYILQTILDKGDQRAVSWLLAKFEKGKIKDKLSQLKLSPQSAKFWNLYLS